jgi:membrane protein YdbS with pleckstrin-like domain
MNYEKPSKKAIGCMYLASFIFTTILFGIGIALLELAIPKDMTVVRYVLMGILALQLLNFLAGPIIRYNRYQYLINEEAIDVKEGFLYIVRHIVPIERLHNIEVSKGPIDRVFGMSEVKVTTAGSTVSIKFLEDKQAEFIVSSLQKRINEVVREKKSSHEPDEVNLESVED